MADHVTQPAEPEYAYDHPMIKALLALHCAEIRGLGKSKWDLWMVKDGSEFWIPAVWPMRHWLAAMKWI